MSFAKSGGGYGNYQGQVGGASLVPQANPDVIAGSAITLTGSNLEKGLVLISTTTDTPTLAFPSAASITAQCPNMWSGGDYGASFECVILRTITSGAGTFTYSAGTGVTLVNYASTTALRITARVVKTAAGYTIYTWS